MSFICKIFKHFTIIFTSIIFFYGCPGSSDNSDIDTPLGNLQFTYLQDDRILYFAIEVEPSINRSPLESTVLYWYGTDTTVSPDNLLLNDEGESGDIIRGDDLYSLKILNDTIFLANPISLEDTGKVHMKFQANYGNGSSFMFRDSFFLGNIIPQLQDIIAPNTIVRPTDNSVIFKVVKAKAYDANGLDDIRRVGFVSYHVEGDSFLNKGDLINLYDDGSEVIIYEPNFTSGDSIANDAIYSFRVPIFGSGNVDPSLQTKTGTFNWIFDAMDMSNSYSDTVIHRVIVE
jgi:hypothetical protein